MLVSITVGSPWSAFNWRKCYLLSSSIIVSVLLVWHLWYSYKNASLLFNVEPQQKLSDKENKDLCRKFMYSCLFSLWMMLQCRQF